jgi:capsid protein
MAEINKMSLIDRARMAVSNFLKPKAYQGSFESARYSIARTRVDAPPPADFRSEMNESTRLELVRLSRWLEKNNGFYKQIIRDTAIYAVGDGIWLQSVGGDGEWQSLVEAEWAQECESPEVTGRFSMLESLYIISETIDRDGEIFILKTSRNGKPKFQIIETHRVRTPDKLLGTRGLSDGILYDNYGKPLYYYVTQADGSYYRAKASAMMHIYTAEHASAGRAYPPHQHAINNLRDEIDLLSMEKIAAKDNSRVSRILQTADTSPDIGDVGFGSPTNKPITQTQPEVISRALGGVTAVLNPNEKLVEHTPARPTAAFNGFIEHLRRDSVMGGLPYEFVADPNKLGGAASRLVVAKAGRYVAHRQNILIKRFLSPYFQYWLGMKIDKKEIPSAVNWWRHEWQVSKPVTVDNGRDAVNARADLQMGIRTPQDIFQENGMNFERALLQKAQALAYRDRVAKAFNLEPERLLSLKTQAEIQTDGQQKMVRTQAIADGKEAPDLTAEKEINQAATNIVDPETEEPDFGEGSEQVEETQLSVDNIPKQNQGIDRSREQPPTNNA